MPKSTYTAILIDPFLKSFSKVSIERGENELKNIYALLDCDLIETVSPSFGEAGDRVVIDEEGLFKCEQAFFFMDGMRLAGKALYVGNYGSLFATPEISLMELSSRIGFNADPYRQWIETFLDEKGIDVEHTFEYNREDGFALISVGAIVEQICVSGADVQRAIKNKLAYIDFRNGDVLDFLRFLGADMAGRQMAG